ncbi:MAG: hypothetical protein ABIN67_19010 [Ferruginibacter sp.]
MKSRICLLAVLMIITAICFSKGHTVKCAGYDNGMEEKLSLGIRTY